MSRAKASRVSQSVIDALLPPVSRTVSEWAAQKRVLSAHSSSPGRWKNSYTPYLVQPMDMFGSYLHPRVVLMTSAQVGKSECGLNVLLRTLDDEPCPMMFVLPNEDMAKRWSRGRLREAIVNIPSVAKAVPRSNSRKDGSATLLDIHFGGGSLRLVGAHSASGLASAPVKMLYLDEIDHYEDSAGTEGDPVNLAEARTTTFPDRAIMYTSTPTTKGHSRIEALFEQGDKRRWHCDCEACGHTWVWDFFEHVRFKGRDPKTARLLCPACGVMHDQPAVHRMSAKGRWIATESDPKQADVASFHFWGIHTPWTTMADITAKFLEARAGKTLMKTFYNLVLGQSWIDQGDGVKEAEARKQVRTFSPETVPPEVLVLTAAVDVQKDRLELYIAGWNEQHGHYGLAHEVFNGDTSLGSTWMPLADTVRLRRFYTTSGHRLRVSAICVDTSYNTDPACRGTVLLRGSMPKGGRAVAIRGSHKPDERKIGDPVRSRVRKRGGTLTPNLVDRYWIGVNVLKDLMHYRMLKEVSKGGWIWGEGFKNAWFKQLTAEKRVTRKVRGRTQRIWEPREGHERNEALDLSVYSYAALLFLKPVWKSLRRIKPVREPIGDNIPTENALKTAENTPENAENTPENPSERAKTGRKRRKRRILTMGRPANRPGRHLR